MAVLVQEFDRAIRINLGLIKLFNIYNFGYFTKASNPYFVTVKGKIFLEKSHDLFVLNPEVFEDRKAKAAKSWRTCKSSNRNKHYLPKIRVLLLDSKRWLEVQERGAYEYPGFATQRKQSGLANAKDLILCGTTDSWHWRADQNSPPPGMPVVPLLQVFQFDKFRKEDKDLQ